MCCASLNAEHLRGPACPDRQTPGVTVVLISGPIASGKSTLGRALAARLRESEGGQAAVIDLDLIYEMLDPEKRPKTNAAIWSAARRAAGRLADGLLAEGGSVVVEGDLAGDRALGELVGELPPGADVWLVALEVSFATGFDRATNDPTWLGTFEPPSAMLFGAARRTFRCPAVTRQSHTWTNLAHKFAQLGQARPNAVAG